ncbi:SigE family RNA polymerase sigma factor [Longispora albida]|uniref:SigE family RNA polymerase sigma factor n=1 Tax=Longispora albida TaxID=203523 RepID=UPI000368B07B|nr:SigE family RNA polymerase sigma factor [Longispora albida]
MMVQESPPAQVAARGFEELYAAHFHSLTVQLYAYTGDMGHAQEVVQEAFCRAYSRWKKIAEYEDPVAWVRKVAWNLATSRWRRARTATNFLRGQREEHVSSPSPDRVALANALKALPGNQRKAVVLHYLADLPISDIARELGSTENTVKSWLHRGRIALAAQLIDKEQNNV